jgi:L-tartrate/succinate antiporter
LKLVKKMGRRTLTLGYAVAFADLLLAPFHALEYRTQRRHRLPGDPQPAGAVRQQAERPEFVARIGGYLMWTAIATTCVTSSMFITALAPNLLAIELINKTAKI